MNEDEPTVSDREIDRHDPAVGSPAGSIVLATASGFSDDRVRSDLVLPDHPGGGRVFSVGSIAWCGCLSADADDNTVARVTGNVLEEFLR